ncbi:hypothetical protein LUZ60_000228 [Juncus effusus]|nr:hypothetical protein LUZ60_000228 [Juncus effusus]
MLSIRLHSMQFSIFIFLFFLYCLSVHRAIAMAASSSNAADIYKNPENMTPLQKHVAFFDRNKDGLIYPWETYQGFRAIGAGVALSTTASAFINGFLGPKTLPAGKWPSPLCPIYVENIKKAKHGGDSGVYDSEGRFVSEKFEAIFQNHAKTRPDALTSKELDDLLQANKDPKDSKGSFAGQTEWKVLYSLCKDKDGFLHKDTVRGVYDGTLFSQMEQGKACSQNKS